MARHLADRLCSGFRYHDEGAREDAVHAFYEVDRRQFRHLDESEAEASARAFVDALWGKDAVEEPYAVDGDVVDRSGIASADWSPVRSPLERRSDVVGMPTAYARATTDAWREHKAGGDYWTPTLRAQQLEIRAATGEPGYPQKQSDGISGYGSLPAQYLTGLELHDRHTERHWNRAVDVMTGYFEDLLQIQGADQ